MDPAKSFGYILLMPANGRSQINHMNDVMLIFDDAGDVIETQDHKGDFKEW